MNGYAVNQFGHTLNLVVNCQQKRKFPHDIADRLDELVSATNSEETAKSNTSQNTANFDLNALPDLEPICKKKNLHSALFLSSSG